MITTAATLAPCTCSGRAVGDFQDEMNVVVEASAAVVEGVFVLPLVELHPTVRRSAADANPNSLRVCMAKVLSVV
jgi:hypothetical protein